MPVRYQSKPVKVEAIEFDGSVKCVNAIAKWTNSLVTEKIIRGDILLEIKSPGNISGLTLRVGDFIVKRSEELWVYDPKQFLKIYEEEII